MTSDELRAIRQRLRLTQEHLGLWMGLDRKHVSRLETSRQPTQQQERSVWLLEYLADRNGAGYISPLLEYLRLRLSTQTTPPSVPLAHPGPPADPAAPPE